MKSALAVLAVLTLVSCGSNTGDTATDPTPDQPSTSGDPGAIPAADGLVGSRDLVTVMDTGEPELCLGAVAESYPPQCSGLPMAGWDWKDYDGVFEKSGDTRWGLFSVQGTWDGETFTVSSAIPAALYDPAPMDPEQPPVGGDDSTTGPDEAKILESLTANPFPGTLMVMPSPGTVLVDVVYDDGSLQAEATERYGDGTVTITSALVDIER